MNFLQQSYPLCLPSELPPCPGRPPRKAPQDKSWYLGAWEREGGGGLGCCHGKTFLHFWRLQTRQSQEWQLFPDPFHAVASWKASEVSKSPGFAVSWLEVNISRRPLLIRKHISHYHIFISYIHIDIHIGRGMVPVVHSRCTRAGTFGKYKVGDLLYTDSRKLHTAYTWSKPGDASILLTEGSSWNDLALSMCH